jgi:hypothetical protein
MYNFVWELNGNMSVIYQQRRRSKLTATHGTFQLSLPSQSVTSQLFLSYTFIVLKSTGICSVRALRFDLVLNLSLPKYARVQCTLTASRGPVEVS